MRCRRPRRTRISKLLRFWPLLQKQHFVLLLLMGKQIVRSRQLVVMILQHLVKSKTEITHRYTSHLLSRICGRKSEIDHSVNDVLVNVRRLQLQSRPGDHRQSSVVIEPFVNKKLFHFDAAIRGLHIFVRSTIQREKANLKNRIDKRLDGLRVGSSFRPVIANAHNVRAVIERNKSRHNHKQHHSQRPNINFWTNILKKKKPQNFGPFFLFL